MIILKTSSLTLTVVCKYTNDSKEDILKMQMLFCFQLSILYLNYVKFLIWFDKTLTLPLFVLVRIFIQKSNSWRMIEVNFIIIDVDEYKIAA